MTTAAYYPRIHFVLFKTFLRWLWSRVTAMSQTRPLRPRFKVACSKVAWKAGGRTEKRGQAGGQRQVNTKVQATLLLLPASRPFRFPGRPQNQMYLMDLVLVLFGTLKGLETGRNLSLNRQLRHGNKASAPHSFFSTTTPLPGAAVASYNPETWPAPKLK